MALVVGAAVVSTAVAVATAEVAVRAAAGAAVTLWDAAPVEPDLGASVWGKRDVLVAEPAVIDSVALGPSPVMLVLLVRLRKSLACIAVVLCPLFGDPLTPEVRGRTSRPVVMAVGGSAVMGLDRLGGCEAVVDAVEGSRQREEQSESDLESDL